jgi:hypothetical protein
MPHSMSKIVEKLSEFGPLMEHRQLVAAVRIIYAACQTIACSNLSENERGEISGMLAQAVQTLNSDADVQKYFPFHLVFKAGREKELLPILDAMLTKLKALPPLETGKIAC